MIKIWVSGLIALLSLVAMASAHAQSGQQFPVEQRHIYSMPGQTLLDLVRSLFPNHKPYWKEITEQFVSLNPNVFSDNRTTLMQGTRLAIPTQLREWDRAYLQALEASSLPAE